MTLPTEPSTPASPFPLWGGTARSAKGGGTIQSNPPADTSPLLGEVGRG
jgi:hypothetical protein